MKKMIVTVLCAFVIVELVFAHSTKVSSARPSVTEIVKQVEQDWADATVDVDTNKLSQILADDWRGVGYLGKVSSKEGALSYVQAGKSRLESYEFGPMDVKVLGNVAVVQGSITENRKEDGQKTIFKAAWMDVLEQRGDKWVVVRSQSARLN